MKKIKIGHRVIVHGVVTELEAFKGPVDYFEAPYGVFIVKNICADNVYLGFKNSDKLFRCNIRQCERVE